jgi:hypothetical protein
MSISTRTRHGIFWGMVATPIAALLPLTAMALSLWPAPQPMGPALAVKILGPAAAGPLGYALAALWALLYGGFWGGVLASVSGPLDAPVLARPSALSYGLGVGLYRALVGGLTVPLWLRWGPFGLLVSAKLALGILLTDLLFGAVAGWLLAREDWDRYRVPYPRLRFGPA